MQEIKSTYVTFEQAKLLKEKGWDINTYSNCWVKTLDGDIIHNSERKNCIEHDRCEQYLMQPEHWEVVEWAFLNLKLVDVLMAKEKQLINLYGKDNKNI